MAKKKDMDVKIKIAIITGIFSVLALGISGYVSSPIADTQWKERPIADVSFGNNDKFPKSTLQSKDGEFFIDIVMENSGKSNAKTVFVASGENTMVRIGAFTDWGYDVVLPFTIKPDPFEKQYPLYVMPDEDVTSFRVGISLETHDKTPPFQEITAFSPTVLTFEKHDGQFVLINQR
ncbi:MAG: hypothetical protein JKY53_14900 [Flavobacteriales bacterium]|nr:hypothetical protein [Flavobacteriales bacterium]